KDIQDNFIEADRKDRKVKQAGFIVLHQTVMPSVLVETGFLTNDEEGAYLDSKKGQSQMGEAIGKAILTYKESAMANMADFDPVAMAEAPDPDRANQGDASDAKDNSDIADASGAADAARSMNAPDGTDASKAAREERRQTRRERKQAEKTETERDAGTASSKETAQIIDEARNQSKRTTDSEAVQEPGEVVVSARPQPVEEKGNPTKSNNANENPENQKQNTARSSETAGAPSYDAPRIMYKVQIMASAKDLPLRPASFNGLNRVVKEPFNNLYRYVYGSTSSLREAEMLKSNADIKGYPSSFIVVYRDGERITFKESKKFLSKQ
ncbi:MAG: N-acetylmuramoyl-L-alanine amidase, partial [Pricia sp.]